MCDATLLLVRMRCVVRTLPGFSNKRAIFYFFNNICNLGGLVLFNQTVFWKNMTQDINNENFDVKCVNYGRPFRAHRRGGLNSVAAKGNSLYD